MFCIPGRKIRSCSRQDLENWQGLYSMCRSQGWRCNRDRRSDRIGDVRDCCCCRRLTNDGGACQCLGCHSADRTRDTSISECMWKITERAVLRRLLHANKYGDC